MDLLTLDTNAVRDWLWCKDVIIETRYRNRPTDKERIKKSFDKLVTLRDDGICAIGITNQLFTDYEKNPDELPFNIQDLLGPLATIALPSISTLPWVLPTVLLDEEKIKEILVDVFPNSQEKHRKYKNNRKDALQLYAHYVAKRDYFITSDKGIIRSKTVLLNKWNIKIITLDEYISLKEKELIDFNHS